MNLYFDMEVYPNYTLAAFKGNSKHSTIEFDPIVTSNQIKAIDYYFKKYTIIGYNILNYDLPILLYTMQGHTSEDIYKLSCEIIKNGSPGWMVMRDYGLEVPRGWDYVDLYPLTSGLSLKTYGARIGTKTIRSLPYNPMKPLTHEEKQEVKAYCLNDLQITEDLYKVLADKIELRSKMNESYADIDFRSKSDAQIAETIMKFKLKSIRNSDPVEPFKYNPPENLRFITEQGEKLLETICECEFTYTDKMVYDEIFEDLTYKGKTNTYKLGGGGLHSTEKSVIYKSDENYSIIDADVTSYYPSIIINNNLYPGHIGKKFVTTYKEIVDERIKAKANGDKVKAETLKIVINSSFGKFGNSYSTMFSPKLLIQTTISGQLYLLSLIEELEEAGIVIISTNTDGVICYVHNTNAQLYTDICSKWQNRYKLSLEKTAYKVIALRDVNNYFAQNSIDNGMKTKGCFYSDSVSKVLGAEICYKAVMDKVLFDKPIERTIRNADDFKGFLFSRDVRGGAVHEGEEVGSIVRYYWSKTGNTINYKKNNNLVPNSTGSRVMMTMGSFIDIDFERYITYANKILKGVGYVSEN